MAVMLREQCCTAAGTGNRALFLSLPRNVTYLLLRWLGRLGLAPLEAG